MQVYNVTLPVSMTTMHLSFSHQCCQTCGIIYIHIPANRIQMCICSFHGSYHRCFTVVPLDIIKLIYNSDHGFGSSVSGLSFYASMHLCHLFRQSRLLGLVGRFEPVFLRFDLWSDQMPFSAFYKEKSLNRSQCNSKSHFT